MSWWWVPLGFVVALCAVGVYVARSFRWMVAETGEDRYFSRPIADRRALKVEMRRRARLLAPLLAVGASAGRKLALRQPVTRHGVTRHRGVTAPGPACPQRVFEEATRYEPDKGDIFVATQMKCGTTWMQQIVYETLCRGGGDLTDGGLRTMYALSPWIESAAAVPMERAARVGERRDRIIKTHFPTSLCPYGEDARYVYVTRHPVSCFASCVDFIQMLAGPFAPAYPDLLDFYCSDEMWWRSWPEHVDGWWRWAQERDNVTFLHYEHMLDDLDAAVGQVAGFLDVALTPDERREVVRKSDYAYMKEHEEHFEMSPPSLMQRPGKSFLQSGTKERGGSVSEADRARIAAFCRERLKDSPYPLAEFYPDVAAG